MRSALICVGAFLPFVALTAPAPRSRLPYSIYPRQDNATCNLADLQQPSNAMAPPPADQSLVLIALGQGTQNYTCANSTATPTAIGALAQLFNASCAVAQGSLGSIEEDGASIGAHFFLDDTTPDFDIIGLGNTVAKKVEAVPAPQATDVPWLRLEAQQEASTSPVRQIYRLNTVGGVAPESCQGQQGVITVEYEAQYWIYASTEEISARRRKRGLGSRLA